MYVRLRTRATGRLRDDSGHPVTAGFAQLVDISLPHCGPEPCSLTVTFAIRGSRIAWLGMNPSEGFYESTMWTFHLMAVFPPVSGSHAAYYVLRPLVIDVHDVDWHGARIARDIVHLSGDYTYKTLR